MSSARASGTPDLFDPPASQVARATDQRDVLPWRAMLLIAAGVIALLWGAWVTKAVVRSAARPPAIAAVRLQPLVAQFVEAQAHSGSPEGQVALETRAFMARLDAELAKRGRAGTTVLVAEAVLSKNVPDITEEVRRAVQASAPPAMPLAGGDRASAR